MYVYINYIKTKQKIGRMKFRSILFCLGYSTVQYIFLLQGQKTDLLLMFTTLFVNKNNNRA